MVPVLSTTPRGGGIPRAGDLDDARRPTSRAVAPHEAHAGLLQALDGDAVVPVVGRLVADAGEDGAPVGHDLGRAGEACRPGAPRRAVFAARIAIFDGMHP